MFKWVTHFWNYWLCYNQGKPSSVNLFGWVFKTEEKQRQHENERLALQNIKKITFENKIERQKRQPNCKVFPCNSNMTKIFFLRHRNLNHGPLELKATVLPMSHTDLHNPLKTTLVQWGLEYQAVWKLTLHLEDANILL